MVYLDGLDVVVCNYRTPSDLADFLFSLEQHPPTAVPWDASIVNVDPLSVDEKVAAEPWSDRLGAQSVRRIGFPDDNVGYARACNAAAVQGRRKVLAFFNADVMLTPGALDACYGALMSRLDWGVLGPKQVDEHRRITSAGVFGTLDRPQLRSFLAFDSLHYNDIRDDAVTVAGAAYFVKRSVWDELTACCHYQAAAPDAAGAFLPTQHYYEETYCSYHAQAHGYRCVYFGEVSIIHKFHRASPIGGHADQQMPASRELFRRACDLHGIQHD